MRRSPSAPLLLGVISGLIAAVAILPTAVPLGWQISAAERDFTVQTSERALSAGERMLLRDGRLPANPTAFGADGLLLIGDASEQVGHVPIGLEGLSLDCTGWAQIHELQGSEWAVACHELSGDRRLYSIVQHRSELASNLALLIGALSLIVGIITALGVLRILRPLSHIALALERVRMGEHGVRVQRAGMAELDDLIEELNAAASAMEEREDAIRGRIAVVHELARIVAHEVRNPLQSLELLTSLIAAEPNIEERRELMHAIQTEIRNLDGVVTRLLREGIDQSGFRLSRSTREVHPILEQVITLRRPEAHRRGVLIEGELQRGVVASVDTALFARSMENLVSNALQAVPDGKGKIVVKLARDEDSFVVRVDDNGPGVSPELSPTVFDPHVTGRKDGHGLGLSMVREVLRAHGGTVHHERSPMGGAAFIARIPLEEESP
ncbi:MAG: HAMP domain-containing histidine kinase [Deltaproteobacteria bacterium]|nr:MAG: HAMP domain-containing histidine kinase [Deltaproteobacteria bacterium]